MKKDALTLISIERSEQIYKHGMTTELDVVMNSRFQMSEAARVLLAPELTPFDYMKIPDGWNELRWNKMLSKPYDQRVIIAGAFCAAEYDRLKNK